MLQLDTLGRPLRSLRISVTDRCNIRCAYCMPEQEYTWLPREDLLSFEEVARLVDVFIGLGVDRVRLTGGEPLLRRDLPDLVAQLARKPELAEVTMTTNGVVLAAAAEPLRRAGLTRVTVSLDTLRPDRFVALTRSDSHGEVVAGIEAARRAFGTLKIDAVIMRGVNDDELSDLVEFGRQVNAEVRFIEYMDVGGATRWTPEAVVSQGDMLADLTRRYGPITPLEEESTAPAERFRLDDGTVFGIIASTTRPFCRACDRARLTADGLWLSCLYARAGLDLRTPVRSGETAEGLARLIAGAWARRDDRGAERRLELANRSVFVSTAELQTNRHLEMHKRGG